MNTVQLKRRISERLNSIDDESFLKALDLLTRDKSNEGLYTLSDEQKERVFKSRKQLMSEQTIPQEKLQGDIEKWLESK